MTPFSSVQLLGCVQLSATPWTAAHEASLSITNSRSLLKLMSIESVMPSNHLILCCPLLSPSIFPTIRVFSNESVLHIRRPKDWSFSFSISPSNEYSGLMPFRVAQSWTRLKRLSSSNFLQDVLAGSPCSLRDSHESFPTPEFKCINSLVLSFLYSPTVTSIHDYWQNHSLDQTDFCWQSNVSAF